jgi:hypothetical protein
MIWGLGLATAGVSLPGLCLMVIAWITFAGTLAGVGLWFSTACTSTLRATIQTLIVTAGIGALPGILYLFCMPFCGLSELTYLISPATSLFWLSCTEQEFFQNEIRTIGQMFGLFLWALAAVFLWSITRTRFRMISSRMPYRRPDPLPPANSDFLRQFGERQPHFGRR